MGIEKPVLRSLVAIPFIYQGIDATVNSEKHATLAKRHFSVFERLGLPPLPHDDLKILAKGTGLATTWLAWRLLRGKTPRLSILGLSVVNFASAAVQAWQTNPGEADSLDGSRISAALGIQAGLLSLLKKPTR